MVARQKRAMASSEGALLIDELVEWLDAQIDSDPERRRVRRAHPSPERMAAQVALGYFLPYPVAPRIDFDPELLCGEREPRLGPRPRARAPRPRGADGRPPARRRSRLPLRGRAVGAVPPLPAPRGGAPRLRPLAHYLEHLARWYLEGDRGEHVERVVQTLLDAARGAVHVGCWRRSGRAVSMASWRAAR